MTVPSHLRFVSCSSQAAYLPPLLHQLIRSALYRFVDSSLTKKALRTHSGFKPSARWAQVPAGVLNALLLTEALLTVLKEHTRALSAAVYIKIQKQSVKYSVLQLHPPK